MSASDEGRPSSLRQKLDAFLEKQIHERDEFCNALAGVSDIDLRKGTDALCIELPSLGRSQVERAAEVAKHGNYYYRLSKGTINSNSFAVDLTPDEKSNLISERERLFSQRGMLSIICTKLGAMNAIPFLTAAFPGTVLSLPVNYCLGRRGALGLSALLIIASSIGSGFAHTWQQILGARVVGGIVPPSSPLRQLSDIGEALRYWPGSFGKPSLLHSLPMADTLMKGHLWHYDRLCCKLHYCRCYQHSRRTTYAEPNPHGGRYHALQWIAAVPAIPPLLLFIAVCYCYESPRFYMRPDSPNYDLDRAFKILLQLQATRDLFLIWWSTQNEEGRAIRAEPQTSHGNGTVHPNDPNEANDDGSGIRRTQRSGLTYSSLILVVLQLSEDQFKPLFTRRRLKNALWSSCTVALAQQLCGNGIFSDWGVKTSMGYSFGFGCVNFLFGLLVMRSIDIIGRRRWLLSTLPVMSLFLMAATVAYAVGPQDSTGDQPKPVANTPAAIVVFAAAYSPGLGPIPFTLASESFPLKHREAGASVAISINLFFAGLLTILLPRINAHFKMVGTLGFFAGLNIVAFVLIFLFVEETEQLTLEELDKVFDNPKRQFVKERIAKRVPFVSQQNELDRDGEGHDSYDVFPLENRETRV
ncbi:unnamed protein product [Fusarium graminearum]|uniref:Major facilitator superfamily (MFS) profile domain-containing protein n=1 Tax=Gibberella zeae TaxID=5518 RepID=A0A9N8NHQ6_GIBZA|nr:unnamed protein product [Fusarium graminearum]CAG1979138.1 unnamed protein product [Fusarium graminearum]